MTDEIIIFPNTYPERIIELLQESIRTGRINFSIGVDPKVVSREEVMELISILDGLHRSLGGQGIVLSTITSNVLDGRARVTVRE